MKFSVAVVLGAACASPPPTFHRDIEPLTQTRCAPCHDGSGLAPLPLRTWAEVAAVKDSVRVAVEGRTMPPWSASRDCAGLESDGSLTDEEIETVVRWVSEGAVEGAPQGNVPAPLSVGLSRVDLTLQLPEPYVPVGLSSDYRCFIIEWPMTAPTHITGFRTRPGNAALVHHAIGFVAPPELVPAFRALDDADEGPGYLCTAGPGLIDRRVSWIGAWEPGSQGDEYPDGTGFRVTPGAAVVVQMHYDTTRDFGGSDQSTFELALQDDVEHEAWVLPWVDPAWITTDDGMLIPAGDPKVTHSYFSDPTALWSDGEPISIRGVSLHMHLLGTRGGLSIRRADGTTSCLLDIPRWDFGWQRSYRLAAPQVLRPGDRLGIECQWDNSAAHQPLSNGQPQPPKDRAWGPGTSDEMCLGALFVTR